MKQILKYLKTNWFSIVVSTTFWLSVTLMTYLGSLKLLDMYDLMALPDTKVHAYCMGVRQWGVDEVCHCYEIHGRVCYGDRAMGSDIYKQELIKRGR